MFQNVAMSHDGTRIAAADMVHNKVLVWDVNSGRQIATLETTYPTHLAFSPDGKWLATGGTERYSATEDAQVILWDTATWKPSHTLAARWGYTFGLLFSPDNGSLISVGTGRKGKTDLIEVWDVSTGAEVRSFPATSYGVRGWVLTPDGQHVITAEYYDLIDHDLGNGTTHSMHKESLSGQIAISPDGNLIAVNAGTLEILEYPTLRLLRKLDEITFPIAFSPDGRYLAAANWGGLTLWKVKTGEKLRTIKYPDNDNSIVTSFSSDWRWLIVGGHSISGLHLFSDPSQMPLTFGEVEDALKKGVPRQRMIALVKEYGVDFGVDPEKEKRLRSAGADAELLFAIAQSKK